MERLTNRYSDGTVFIPENIKQRFGMQSVYDRLAEYEDFEEQGLLLKLKLKVGDIFWEYNEKYIGEEIYPRKAHSLMYVLYCMEFLGKTTFLTKEEAEQKLKEIKGE